MQPLVWLSERVLWKGVDQGLIDGAGVNGFRASAGPSGGWGAGSRSGQVGTYVFVFVVGAVWLLRAVAR